MSRLRNKKLRKKGELIAKLDSLNKLHDLKNMNAPSASLVSMMLQFNKLKPRKTLSVGCRIPKKYPKMPMSLIES